MKIKLSSLISLCLLLSCASQKPAKEKNEIIEALSLSDIVTQKQSLELVDQSGKFSVIKESGVVDQGKRVVVKRKMFADSSPNAKVLEKSITISTLGVLAKKVRVLRPLASQYSVWLDGQKYFSEMKINKKEKAMQVKMVSPDEKWNGEKIIKFPRGSGVYCFFSQLYECVFSTQFIQKAIASSSGQMNFHIIWDGYPFLAEQYSSIPEELFTDATIEYNGQNELKEYRFSLKFKEQVLFYLLSPNLKRVKLYWIAENYSLLPTEN